MSDNTRFWVGVGAAFVVPLLSYSYMQGRTDSSIEKLSSNVDQVQKQVDELTKATYKIKGNTDKNAQILQRLDSNMGSVVTQVNSQAIEMASMKIEIKELKEDAKN